MHESKIMWEQCQESDGPHSTFSFNIKHSSQFQGCQGDLTLSYSFFFIQWTTDNIRSNQSYHHGYWPDSRNISLIRVRQTVHCYHPHCNLPSILDLLVWQQKQKPRKAKVKVLLLTKDPGQTLQVNRKMSGKTGGLHNIKLASCLLMSLKLSVTR